MLGFFKKGQPDPSSPSQELRQACLDLLAAHETLSRFVDRDSDAAKGVDWVEVDFAKTNAEYVVERLTEH